MYKRNQDTIQVAKDLRIREGERDRRAGEDDLKALGFQVLLDDDLFYTAVPPRGWEKRHYGYTGLHTEIVDERGITRITQFFKEALYDTRANANIVNPRVLRYVGTYGQEIPNDELLARFKELDDKLVEHDYNPLKVEDQFSPVMRENLGWKLAIKLKDSLSDETSKDIYLELFDNHGPVDGVATKLASIYKRSGLLTDKVRAGIDKGVTEFYQQARDEGVGLYVLTRSSQTIDDVTVSARVNLYTKEARDAICMQIAEGVWYVKDLQLMGPEVEVYGKLDAENLDSQLERIATIKGTFEEVFGELLQRP